MEIIINNPNLKLQHIRSSKVYVFNKDTELLKYDDTKFKVLGEQKPLF